MRSKQDIRTISDLATSAPELIDQINDARRPVYIIQDGKARAVLMDPQSFEEMRQALGLMKLIVQGEKDFQKGRALPREPVFQRIEDRLRRKKESTTSHEIL